MVVMVFLAAAHLGFWGWGAALAYGAGAIGVAEGVALAVWLALIGLWLVVVARMSRSGWLSGPGLALQPWLWLPMPPVMISVIAILFLPVLRDGWMAALSHLPAPAIPGLNALRILALGTVMKATRGLLPRRIGYGVGIPDTLFGVWSLAVALGGGFAEPRVAVVWHLTGAMILFMMIPMIWTSLRPPRLDAVGRGDGRAILAFPLVLAPAGLATLFLILHGLALYSIAMR